VRIMVDTNVLLSALVFGSAKMLSLVEKVADEHTMILCSHIIDEFRGVVTRKSPKYNDVVDTLFGKLSFEMVYTPKWQERMPDIRDEKDKPILVAALEEKVSAMNGKAQRIVEDMKLVTRRIDTLKEHISHSENFKAHRGLKRQY